MHQFLSQVEAVRHFSKTPTSGVHVQPHSLATSFVSGRQSRNKAISHVDLCPLVLNFSIAALDVVGSLLDLELETV